MFLSDKLYNKALEVDTENFDSVKKIIIDMINICMDNMKSNAGKLSNEAVIANFKRVNKTWIEVAKKLEQENKGLVKENGFALFCLSKEEWKDIHWLFN